MAQHARPVGPTTNAAAGFSPEMAAGSVPQRPSLPFAAKPGHAVSQVTHVAAPFTSSMSAGWQPSVDVRSAPFTQGGFIAPPEIPVFSIEMIVGSRPTSPRILLGARIPLPVAQTTPVAAPFTPDMAYGSRPERGRPPFRANVGWSDSQLTFAVAMTPEMFAGSVPARNREALGPKIPLPVSQTTPVAAPFSQEMAAGSKPDQPRPPFQVKVGWSVAQPTFDVPMTPEMFAGSLPLRNRERLGPRIPLPVSQTTPVAAPFAIEMVLGHHPDRHRYVFPLRIDLPLTVQVAVLYFVSRAAFKTTSDGLFRSTEDGTMRTTE